MANQVFLLTPDGLTIKSPATPEWATHIVKRRKDGVLFFARNPSGEDAFYIGSGTTFEFHPDGYDVYSQMKTGQIVQAVSDAQDDEMSVGQKWWVENGDKKDLLKVNITYLTEKVVTLESCDEDIKTKTLLRGRVVFVERAPD
jgi:hypothetical protein